MAEQVKEHTFDKLFQESADVQEDISDEEFDTLFDGILDVDEIINDPISMSTLDITPDGLVRMVDEGIIELPVFQRKFVWDIKKASKLIESLILGMPIPELFFFASNENGSAYKVIDGQQRLLTVYLFLKGKFPKSGQARLVCNSHLINKKITENMNDESIYKSFRLSLADNSTLDKKLFADLNKDIQTTLCLKRSLHVAVIHQNNAVADKHIIFDIFNRLNTGGSNLTAQEIRASLYYCPFYEMMVRLSARQKFKALLCKSGAFIHSEDVEIILRAFALLIDEQAYTPRMTTFLNNFSAHSTLFTQDDVEYCEKLFVSFLDACDNLPEKTFFRGRRFSKALFETVFVSACRTPLAERKLIEGNIAYKSILKLKNDKSFISFLEADSTSVVNTRSRIALADSIIKLN